MKRLRWMAAVLLLLPALVRAEYFLDLSQKGELVSRGQITGRDQAVYDVWIVPGYVGPARMARDGWVDAGRDLKAYGNADLYKDMAHTGRDTLKFARKEAIGKFALRGTATAWSDAFSAAQARTQKRVFGWWFAYPWAVIEATGESVIRVGLGVPGGIVIGGVGSTVVPVAEFLWPAGKSLYHAAVPGTVVPLVGGGWNTVIAPPLAALGQQPNAERADGFWMKRIDPATSDDRVLAESRSLREWSSELRATPEFAGSEADAATYHRQHAEQVRQALAVLEEQKKQADQKFLQQRLEIVKKRLESGDRRPDVAELTALVTKYGKDRFVLALQQSGMRPDEAMAVMDLLLGDSCLPENAPEKELRPDGKKTDPLRRSIELMGK